MPARPEARPGRERALFGRFAHSRSAAGIADPAGASGRVEILRNPVRPAARLVASATIAWRWRARAARLDTCTSVRGSKAEACHPKRNAAC